MIAANQVEFRTFILVKAVIHFIDGKNVTKALSKGTALYQGSVCVIVQCGEYNTLRAHKEKHHLQF